MPDEAEELKMNQRIPPTLIKFAAQREKQITVGSCSFFGSGEREREGAGLQRLGFCRLFIVIFSPQIFHLYFLCLDGSVAPDYFKKKLLGKKKEEEDTFKTIYQNTVTTLQIRNTIPLIFLVLYYKIFYRKIKYLTHNHLVKMTIRTRGGCRGRSFVFPILHCLVIRIPAIHLVLSLNNFRALGWVKGHEVNSPVGNDLRKSNEQRVSGND